MTCREVRGDLVELLDSGAAERTRAELETHLAGCADCAREYAGIQAALGAIAPAVRIQASPDFKARVMSRLTEVPAPAGRWGAFLPRFAFAGAAALALIVLLPFLESIPGGRSRVPASVLSLLAQSAQAQARARTVHMLARMRTTPTDHFEAIDASLDWVPLEIWSQASPPARWRVEKPGRVAVMDGTASMLLIKPDQVSRGTPRTNYLEWMRILLDTDQLMEKELDLARSGASTASISEEYAGASRRIVLTVSRRPVNPFASDWAWNRSISSSDHTRIYRFDAVTKRLEGMQLVMRTRGAEIPVFEITEIRYDETFDPALFALRAPEKAISYLDAEEMPTMGPLPQSPKQAAEMLFDAFSREDWEAARLVYPTTGFSENFKRAFGGLQVISIGEPFRSGFYAGWYVPYEIKFRSGKIKKLSLAVRNDNSVRRWIMDGGL